MSRLVSFALIAAALFATAAQAAEPVTTPTGLVYQSLKEGTGASPLARDTVRVHYRGYFPDTGKEFDSSIQRGKAKLTCPPSIAYGSRGAGGVIPPNATLNFDVELLAVQGK